MPQLGGDDLTLLAEGAGEDVDLVAGSGVVRHGHAGGQGLVVGMRMDEEEPSWRRHV
jgi:hypothetical protein